MTARRAEALVVAALAGLARAAAFVTRTYPNYDAYYHLVWGRELVHGIKPDFQAYSAPTEHPLYIAICAVVSIIATAMMPDYTNRDISQEHDAPAAIMPTGPGLAPEG